MNVSNTTTTRTSTDTTNNVVSIASKTRRTYGARSFGVGYGKSSGYAADKRYTTDWGQIRFRCA
ncbi:MAG: hypothetical protein V4673_18870 [Pseudomonadota bacterium]